MKNYLKHDDWCIVEEGFHPEFNEISESVCSIGNGRMGHRGNFEEQFTGKTLQGNYVAGVYYPDKTRVGWWKNGYPEYFAKVLTVHESSLSPCVHSILAAKLGMKDKAYEMYLRTARLDLDDYNNDTEDGLHITSMAGTWMSVVKGFGGQRVRNGQLHLNPFVPTEWQSFSFKIRFKGNLLNIKSTKNQVVIQNLSGKSCTIFVANKPILIAKGSETRVEIEGLVVV